jgi:hypothetical protein
MGRFALTRLIPRKGANMDLLLLLGFYLGLLGLAIAIALAIIAEDNS